eukprot:TRINITY_DN27423_c0_g1_i1.p1 TRINITY_DN27423_c0_g1~~TRINITY_DN27423_c0_g1_i1.p1  ORF type:complete len:377 (+),score=71.48 TRINITY_DN27423_c0_g1_i1:25-1155(+)
MTSPPLPTGILEGNIDGFLKKEFLYNFSIDKWVDDDVLRYHTFQTEVVAMTVHEGRALLAMHKAWSKATTPSSSSSILSSSSSFLDSVDPSLLPLCKSLEGKLQQAIDKVGGAAFVKLNHRSPKDVVMHRDNMALRACFEHRLASLDEEDYQGRALAWNHAALESLCVTTGPEALALLSHSYRISSDLNTDTEYDDFFRSQLVVRKFEDVHPGFEFRAFVSKGQMTALSQYESGLYFPDLVARREETKSRILLFWESVVRPRVSLESYVIDFCIIGDRVLVVELDPFHAHTSACLFSWKNDREVILNGPFQFRIRDAPLQDPYTATPYMWAEYADRYYTPRSPYYDLITSKSIMVIAIPVLVAGIVLAIRHASGKR